MRVAVALVGSRGDVQPGLAVAAELTARGHEVAVGVAPNLIDLAERLGVAAFPIGRDSRALLESDLVRRRLRSGSLRERYRAVQEVSVDGWDDLRTGLVDLAGALDGGPDLIVTGLLGQEVGSGVAECTGAAFAALHYAPVRANAQVPVLPGVPRGVATAATWKLGEHLRWRLTREEENRQRTALGLPPTRADLPRRLGRVGALEVQAYAPELVPDLVTAWGPQRPFVGFLGIRRADASHVADPELEAHLDREPVYLGFGSMPVADPAALLALVTEVAERRGQSFLIAAGWSDLDDSASELVLVRPEVDHATVLPRCGAIVHHGGAGTTGAALRSGRPQIIAAWSADQPMWGRLIEQAGLGCHDRFSKLTADRLDAALDRVLCPAVRRRAADVATTVASAEQAVLATAEMLEGHVAHHRR